MTAPTLDALQAALCKTTETLAHELARPSDVAPDWSEREWLVARAVASLHGVSPLLSRRLRWQGPAGWRRFLDEQSVHTMNRHRRIQQLLTLIDSRARDDGIPLVALKGVALHAIGLYEVGERPMADIDLLTRDEDERRTVRMLEALDFHETLVTWKHRVFEPNECRAPASFGEHSDNSLKIELHNRIKEGLPLRTVDVTELVWPRLARDGLNGYPSRAALLSHLLLHMAGTMAFRSLRLLQLHDIALLAACMTEADWDEFLSSATTHDETLWWASPPLALTARYYSSIPQRVLNAAASRCPWLLKQACRRKMLSDVSKSRLWVSAWPGIEWSQSFREMLAYASERVAPIPAPAAMGKGVVKMQPEVAASPWDSLSRRRKILLWLMERPPRSDTLFAVRTALAQAS